MTKNVFVVLVSLILCAVAFGSTVQSGWLNYSAASDATLGGTTFQNNYSILMSNSQNNHVARDGTVTGAKFMINNSSFINKGGIVILRLVSGTTYTIIGKSQEITSFTTGENTVVFSTPITDVYPTDIIAMAVLTPDNLVNNKPLTYFTNTAKVPINDSTTAKIRWVMSGGADYTAFATGSNVDISAGGSLFGVLTIAAMMDNPRVVVVGDSISEGAQINYSYRNNATAKNRLGAFAAVGYRTLGWPFEICGNTQTSNNAGEVLTDDLAETGTITVWTKNPEYIHLHVGVNDVYDFMTQGAHWYGTAITTANAPTAAEIETSATEFLAKLDEIRTLCQSHNCKIIMDAIFPWTGNATNTTGKHAQNALRDVWNARAKAWALGKADVKYVDYNPVLGQQRTVAKTGDPTPTAGNLWNLVPEYIATADGLGVHLSQEGCAVAGAALAKKLTTPCQWLKPYGD